MGYFLTINIQGTSLISNPPSKFNIFISKTDSSGNLLWLKHVGEGNECEGKSIITDSQNNIIFTGYFREQITLCDSTLVTNDIVGEFIMKLDQNGNCLWIDYVDFTGSFGPIPLVVDNLDNIYMLTPGNTTINGFSTIGKTVITKFNQQGQVIWMKPTGINMLYLPSNGSDYMVMNSNKIILGGYYKDTITFAGNTYISGIEMHINPITGDTTNFSSSEVLIGMIDTAGNEIKAVNITATGEHTFNAITANPSHEMFISGTYPADTLHINNLILTGGDGYLLKTNADLDLLEVKNIDGFYVYGATTTAGFTYYSGQNWDYMFINIYDFDCILVDSFIAGNNNKQPEYPTSLTKFPNNDIILGGTYIDDLVINGFVAPGCASTTCKMFFTRLNNPLTNLNEIKTKKKSILYPNPVSDILFIDLDHFRSMELFNIAGVLVKGDIHDNEISFKQIPRGIYFLKITTENYSFTKKIIKQ